MKILNLTDLSKSEIKYRVDKMPDGQRNIVIDVSTMKPCTTHWADQLFPVTIKSRFNSWLDLELIVATVASLREIGVDEIHLYTPYFLGARSDRKFEEGGNNYLRDVICPRINELGFKTVTVLDPHSDVLEACLKGFKKESNKQLVHWALATRYFDEMLKSKIDLKEFVLISPDTGAFKKIHKLAEQIGYKGDVIVCSKSRDEHGKLSKTVVPIYGDQFEKDLIVIDDICDGGRTFINIAKAIKENPDGSKFKGKLYLIVTHGIFSAGLIELNKYFDGIYCTNSYSDWSKHQKDGSYSYLKQLNVF